jgi:hypothetical protein
MSSGTVPTGDLPPCPNCGCYNGHYPTCYFAQNWHIPPGQYMYGPNLSIIEDHLNRIVIALENIEVTLRYKR